MILLAALAWRLVPAPCSPDYAMRVVAEGGIEVLLLWGFIITAEVQRMLRQNAR